MSVKVAVRVRPFNSRQKKLGCTCIVDMQDPTTVLKAYNGQAERKFTFDFSFWSFDQFQEKQDGQIVSTGPKYADQKQVYQKIGANILDNAWEGYHCCLFAYGQTGSGKSYSMIGYGVNKGIVPITCNEMFNRVNKKQGGVQYQVYASMLQIYNQQIQDLTVDISKRPKGGLKVRENQLLGVYVDGVKKHYVSSFDQIENVMEEGTKNRTVAATQMNATSSRAHTIITIEFKQITKSGEGKSEKISMINLVDLAGSQRQDKTGATGQRLKQAVGINQSLTSLGQVISVLAENSEKGTNTFVPYRNSALTRILQNALGGNSQTIMICAISPANDNYDQNLSTLRYADRAKKIKNKPIVNESAQDKMIRQLRQENARLRKLLQERGQDPNKQIQLKKEENKEQKKEEKKEEKRQLEEQKKQDQQKQQNKKQENLQNAEQIKKRQQQKKIEQQKRLKEEQEKAKKQQKRDSKQQENIEDLQAYLRQLQKRIAEETKTKEEKKKNAKEDQQKLLNNDLSNNTGRTVKEAQLKKLENQGQSFPYLQNISKDIMIHRKIKILLEKQQYKIGKTGAIPANDICFGGRDMVPQHAIISRIDKKVFLKPLNSKAHLYVNGALVRQTIQLMHLDRVIFGWNSVYLFKNKEGMKNDEIIKDIRITWDFCKDEVAELVDIDNSDDEDGPSDSCCQIY